MAHQYPPNTVKVELTEGCNLRCEFCGIHGIREKAGVYKFLDIPTASRIAEQLRATGWKSKLEFTMHGEPLMNPDYAEILRLFRGYLPKTQIMVSTNSLPLLRPPGVAVRIGQLFEAGINLLVVDCYEIATKAWAQITAEALPDGVKLSHYPGGPSPNQKFPSRERRVILIEDLAHGADSGRLGNRIISNHCGAAAPVDPSLPMKARCARPFRELSIRWDGQVALCCNDWRGEYRCGDLRKSTMLALWNGPEFDAARRMLYGYDRNFGPCAKCDNVSFRVGLLPDRLGKQTLPAPDTVARKIIRRCTSGESYTQFVFRPWEEK